MNKQEELVEEFLIGETKYPNRLREDLYINQSDFNNVFASHAERFAWYSTAHELSLDHEGRLKEELARLYAHIDVKVRTDAAAASVKLTEKMVENTVITHPEYISLQEKYLQAKRNTGILRVARDAMIHRRDMLIQMGANYRAEGNSDISLKSEQYKSM